MSFKNNKNVEKNYNFYIYMACRHVLFMDTYVYIRGKKTNK